MKIAMLFITIACGMSVFAENQSHADDISAPQWIKSSIQIGRYHSRGLLGLKKEGKAPLVILVPGSGPNGPRELIPGSLTVDGKDAAIFHQFAATLNEAGVQTLQLGKPGVEDRTTFDPKAIFYDLNQYKGLHWSDLLNNLDDAFNFALTQPTVDSQHIWILGHSEGTQVAVEYARANSKVAGVILLGYAGEDISTIVDWQIFRRGIDDFVEPDVDTNHDGIITKDEAAKWQGVFFWDWKEGQQSVTTTEIEAVLRADPERQAAFNAMKSTPLYADGIWNRGPIYGETASLKQPVYVFTGQLDEQTPPDEAMKLDAACKAVQKNDCIVSLIPGVGHGFSPPVPPRSHPFLDMTVGPPSQDFLNTLAGLAIRL